jgi:hypothetical protein
MGTVPKRKIVPMIQLPPGCSVAYGITIDIKQLTDEIIEWYELIGGTISTKQHWIRNRQVEDKYVAYGSKLCHYLADGSGNVRLHFLGKDASTACMFMLKFNDLIIRHNLKEIEQYAY